MPARYAVFADIADDPHDPNVDPTDYPAWCDTEEDAAAIMDEMVRETGVSHFIMERTYTENPSPASEAAHTQPLHITYGVTPGVDFPATLGPERR